MRCFDRNSTIHHCAVIKRFGEISSSTYSYWLLTSRNIKSIRLPP